MRLIDADLLMRQICREECEKDGCDFPCLDKKRIEAVPTAAVKYDTVMINWTPDLEKLGRDVGFRALNEFSFMGKSIREWVEIILEQMAKYTWISVEKMLPEEGKRVLAWEKMGFAYVDKMKCGVWEIGANNGAIITHWMPLPEMPEEGEAHD